nr:MAG TPA: DNA primase (bacterial type) [Caudoviricetes sp.]
MTREEIKQTYSMRDILSKCGLATPNRAGFCHCPFHKGDREPSMKIYDRDYNCFGCGANGDIFSFVERFYGISFKEAFLMLGGEYEKDPKYSRRLAIYKAQKSAEMKKKKLTAYQEKVDLNNHLIGVYMNSINTTEPLSDAWCSSYNALQLELYHQEILQSEESEVVAWSH